MTSTYRVIWFNRGEQHMLNRHKFVDEDYINKYVPEATNVRFEFDFLNPYGRRLDKALMYPDDWKEMESSKSAQDIRMVLGLIPSIGVGYLVGKIPRVQRLATKWRRGIVRVGAGYTMMMICATINGLLYAQEFNKMVAKYQGRYILWRFDGDSKVFGPHVRISN